MASANEVRAEPWKHLWLRKLRDRCVECLLFLSASSSVAITVGIVFVLVFESAVFFRHVPLSSFLTDTMWTPLFSVPRYGILPLVAGTIVTTTVALLVALPVGTVVAIYLSEYAPFAVREILKPALELLHAVPTVVYGYLRLCLSLRYSRKSFPACRRSACSARAWSWES